MSETGKLRIRHMDKLFIGGEWMLPEDGRAIDVISPDTETWQCSVAGAGIIDMQKAVRAARLAFDEGPWPRMHPAERLGYLTALLNMLREREAEIARMWSMQIGGLPVPAQHLAAIGSANLEHTIQVSESFAFEAKVPSKLSQAGILIMEPVGVVAAIVPWNSPYALMMGKIAPALAAGCTLIMKPSPETPLEAYIIAECAEKIGLPPGVLNLTPAEGAASDALVHNPGVDKVSFTGSTLTGRHIATVCADRVARCTLELGGKSAAIVLDDYAIEDAAKLLANTIIHMSGQICAMLSRAIVSRARHAALADAIAYEMSQFRVGRSDAPGVQMGPLAAKRQLDRVEDYIAKGKAEGAFLVTGGGRPGHLDKGYFIEPTLFAAVDNRMTIAQEEIFGPVLSLIPCDDLDDAVRIANDSAYGLNGSVLTHDNELAYAIGRRVRSGKFTQNGMRPDFTLPTGGFKQSGIGREGGEEGLRAYLETKVLLLDGYPSGLGMLHI